MKNFEQIKDSNKILKIFQNIKIKKNFINLIFCKILRLVFFYFFFKFFIIEILFEQNKKKVRKKDKKMIN